MDISFYGMDNNPDLKCLYDFCQALDDWLLDFVEKNCYALFKKEKSREVLADKHHRLVRVSDKCATDGTPYAPIMKIHANPDRNNEFSFRVFSPAPENEHIPCTPHNAQELMPKRSRVRQLIKFPSVWFTGQGFGWSCHTQQVVLYPSQSNITVPVMGGLEYNQDIHAEQTNYSTAGMDTENGITVKGDIGFPYEPLAKAGINT